MKTSEKTTALFKAYIEAAPELTNIAKDSKAYNYNYTSLEKLIEHSKPILAKHGLAIIQTPTGNGIVTRLIHASGEWMEEETHSEIIQLKGMNAYQVQGSQITYLRRYAWASMCGIASDEDKDAAGEQSYSHSEKAVNNSKVTAAQVKLIQTRIGKLGIDDGTVQMLKDHYKISSWNDLPANSMNGLIEWFDKK